MSGGRRIAGSTRSLLTILGERFRWLTAPRSAIVQPSPVQAGLTTDPAADLERLFATLVA